MLTDQTGHGVETDPVKVDLYMENKALRERVAELEGALYRIARLNGDDFCLAAHDIAVGALRNANPPPEPLQGEQTDG